MKKNGHPEYQEVLFVDSATGFKFVCGSTMKSNQKEVYNGKEFPVVHLSMSASSHPLYVGGKQVIDTEGRVDRFTKKYQVAQQQRPAAAPVEKPEAVKAAPKKKK